MPRSAIPVQLPTSGAVAGSADGARSSAFCDFRVTSIFKSNKILLDIAIGSFLVFPEHAPCDNVARNKCDLHRARVSPSMGDEKCMQNLKPSNSSLCELAKHALAAKSSSVSSRAWPPKQMLLWHVYG